MGIKIFTSRLLRENEPQHEIASLALKFRVFKEEGGDVSIFGRDAPYHRPSAVVDAGLRHLHLNIQADWNLKLAQYDRTSDTCLVYCSGWYSTNSYLLITLLRGAHTRSQKMTFMMELADIAKVFRDKN